MSKKSYLAFSLAILFVVPSVVFAKTNWWPIVETGWSGGGEYEGLLSFFFGPNIPDFILEGGIYTILQWLIFPFIALWAIMYGIMNEINIFRNSPNMHILLSFLIAAISGPTGGLVYLVRVVFVSIGWWGFLVFGALMFVGIFIWGRGKMYDYGYGGWEGRRASQYLSKEGQIANLLETRKYLMAHGASYGELEEVDKKIAKLQNEIRKLRREMIKGAEKPPA